MALAFSAVMQTTDGQRAEQASREPIAPYVSTWSAEQDLPYRLVERAGHGIGYADELLGDRDAHGVLWQRAAVRHEVGRPEFGKVHPLRQRRAMRQLLCQVCAEPADRTDDGVLWLLRDYRCDWPRWPEGMACVEPPICVPCCTERGCSVLWQQNQQTGHTKTRTFAGWWRSL